MSPSTCLLGGEREQRHPRTGELQMPIELLGTASQHKEPRRWGWTTAGLVHIRLGNPYLLQKAHGQHGVGGVENVVECEEPALVERLEGRRKQR